MKSIFSSNYAGNLMYYRSILKADNYCIDLFEKFNKQSYRNRCVIASPNGPLNLVIPVKRKSKNIFKDVQIDHSQKWKKNHWKSLESAYRSSPYFEYYEDDFKSIYFNNNYKFLIDFNQLIHLHIIKLLEIETQYSFSDSYILNNDEIIDYRFLIHPKVPFENNLNNLSYHQVFQEKQKFLPNLTILDLIFNEGPKARQFLDLDL